MERPQFQLGVLGVLTLLSRPLSAPRERGRKLIAGAHLGWSSCQAAPRDMDRSLLGPGSAPAAFPSGSNWYQGGAPRWAVVPGLAGSSCPLCLGFVLLPLWWGGHALSIIYVCIFVGGFLFQARKSAANPAHSSADHPRFVQMTIHWSMWPPGTSGDICGIGSAAKCCTVGGRMEHWLPQK